MATSPASATNLEWFVRRLCALEVEEAERQGRSPFEFVGEEVEAVLGEKSRVFYHPFLHGSPRRSDATAGFFGLRGWHTRGHLLRALFEGVVFNHKAHVDALCSTFPISEVRLTGGGAKSDLWRQMFADALGVPVKLADTEDSGTRGVALCAGVGAGAYPSVDEAVERVVRIVRTHEPDPDRHVMLAEAYETYTALIEALAPLWSRMD
jgi:L-xylulokinase